MPSAPNLSNCFQLGSAGSLISAGVEMALNRRVVKGDVADCRQQGIPNAVVRTYGRFVVEVRIAVRDDIDGPVFPPDTATVSSSVQLDR